MLLATFLLLIQSEPLPGMTLQSAGKGGTFIVEPFRAASMNRITAELARRAGAHCATLKVRWGRYDAAQNEVGDELRYTRFQQKFSCYDPATDPYKPAPVGWTASPSDDLAAKAAADQHVANLRAGNVRALQVGFEALLEVSPAQAKSSADDFAARTKGQTLTFAKPVWALDPEGAGHPGIYAYLSFQGPRSCGFLMLYRESPSVYRVSRQQVYGTLQAGEWTKESMRLLANQCEKM